MQYTKILFSILIVTITAFNVFAEESLLEEYNEKIHTNQLLGHLLSQQDWAAEVGTDAVIRLGADLSNKKLKAFIVEKLENSWVLSFVGKRKFNYGIYYQIEVSLEGPLDQTYKNYVKPIKLSKNQKSLFKATQLANKQEFLRCSNSYNNSSLPLISENDSSTHFYIYMLPATNDKTLNIGGGHHRFLIDSNKNHVIEHYQHTNSCLNSKIDKDAASLVFTHLTSDVPNEFHIYMSYLYKLPIYVLTIDNEIIWKVFEGKIIAIEYPEEGINSPIQDRMRNIIKKSNKRKH